MGKQVAAGFAYYDFGRYHINWSADSAATIRGFSKLSFLMVERPSGSLKISYRRD